MRTARHPVFLRLLKPIKPYSSEEVVELTMDDEDDPEGSEVGVYLALRPSKLLWRWAADIQRRHKSDLTFETDPGVSFLSLKPLKPDELQTVGEVHSEIYGAYGVPVKHVRGEQMAFARQRLIAVAVRRAKMDAVGFCAFDIRWNAASHDDEYVDLEVELDQAWVDPRFRRKRRGELMAWAVGVATGHHLQQIEQTTRWGAKTDAELRITVGADIYSTSGEAFLRHCTDAVADHCSWWVTLDRLKVKDIEFYPRW